MEKKLSTVFVPPAISVPGQALSLAEVDYFKTNGFLAKPGLLDPDKVKVALARVWDFTLQCVDQNAETQLKSSDPSTWRSPNWQKQPAADKSGPYEGRQRVAVHGHTLKMHELGNRQYLLDLITENERVREVAGLLLAQKLKPTERTRGVYALFPGPELSIEEKEERCSGQFLGPHTDRVCQQLNVCVYLDDVPARSGGFTLYPGSHEIMFRAHEFESNWSPTESFSDCLKQVVESITPVELVGQAGDVFFWHGRCVHTAGIHIGNTIRWAVFADFMRDGDVLDADEHREVGQFEWFKDSKLLRDDMEVSSDMWRNWRLEASEAI